jgi:putative ABC transport system substrate-binding protein
MRRREFITLLGGAAVAWPLTARAQQPAIPVVGYVHSDSPQPVAGLLAAFREGLSETGYVEGQNVLIEYRWAENDLSQLPELVADLVRRRVAVIATPGSSAAALAAKAATTTIPIVFSLGLDPVQLGLVASLSRPGGNITGVNSMSNELAAKRLGLLRELLPTATRFGVLVNPKNPTTQSLKKDLEAAAGRSMHKSSSLPPLLEPTSTRPLRALCKGEPTHSWSIPTTCSSTVAYNSLRWRRATPCQRFIPCALMRKPAA